MIKNDKKNKVEYTNLKVIWMIIKKKINFLK